MGKDTAGGERVGPGRSAAQGECMKGAMSGGPELLCWNCGEREFILGQIETPNPTTLECMCCGATLSVIIRPWR